MRVTFGGSERPHFLRYLRAVGGASADVGYFLTSVTTSMTQMLPSSSLQVKYR
jgi:hypothetical protein